MKARFRNVEQRMFILGRLRDTYWLSRCKAQVQIYHRAGFWYHLNTSKLCEDGMNDVCP